VIRLVNHLRGLGAEVVEHLDAEDEHVYFALPPELLRSASS
jgi:hypothetical protein